MRDKKRTPPVPFFTKVRRALRLRRKKNTLAGKATAIIKARTAEQRKREREEQTRRRNSK